MTHHNVLSGFGEAIPYTCLIVELVEQSELFLASDLIGREPLPPHQSQDWNADASGVSGQSRGRSGPSAIRADARQPSMSWTHRGEVAIAGLGLLSDRPADTHSARHLCAHCRKGGGR